MILFGVMGRRGAMCVCSQFMQFGRSLVGIVWHSSLILPFTPPSDPVARSRAGDLREGTTWRSLGRHHTSTSATRFVAAGRHSETAVGVKSTIRSEKKGGIEVAMGSGHGPAKRSRNVADPENNGPGIGRTKQTGRRGGNGQVDRAPLRNISPHRAVDP